MFMEQPTNPLNNGATPKKPWHTPNCTKKNWQTPQVIAIPFGDTRGGVGSALETDTGSLS